MGYLTQEEFDEILEDICNSPPLPPTPLPPSPSVEELARMETKLKDYFERVFNLPKRKTNMIDYKMGSRILEIVKELVLRKQNFSGGSIAATLQDVPTSTASPKLQEINDYIDTLFLTGEMAGYSRGQQHGAEASIVFSGYLYYPTDNANPFNSTYDCASNTFVVTSPPPLPALLTGKAGWTADCRNVKETQDGVRTLTPLPTAIEVELQNAAKKVTVSSSAPSKLNPPVVPQPPPEPIIERPVDHANDMVYFVDGHGRICIPPHMLKGIGLKPRESVYILSERKRVTVVRDNPVIGCRRGAVGEDGVLRILAISLAESGLAGIYGLSIESDRDALCVRG